MKVTHCDFHLGDNLFHLHLLRHLAIRNRREHFVHFAHSCHLEQLAEVIEDLPNIELQSLEDGRPSYSVDGWKNAGAGTPGGGFFENHQDRNDYYGIYLDWFAELAGRLGFQPVFRHREELLFDWPLLAVYGQERRSWPLLKDGGFDILFINSQPCSGQWMPMASDDGHYLDDITRDLAGRHNLIVTQAVPWIEGVRCTRDYDLSVTDIGHLSLHCRTVIMIGTGSAWPTMNVYNRETVKRRILLLDPERVEGVGDVVRVLDRDHLRAELERLGLL